MTVPPPDPAAVAIGLLSTYSIPQFYGKVNADFGHGNSIYPFYGAGTEQDCLRCRVRPGDAARPAPPGTSLQVSKTSGYENIFSAVFRMVINPSQYRAIL